MTGNGSSSSSTATIVAILATIFVAAGMGAWLAVGFVAGDLDRCFGLDAGSRFGLTFEWLVLAAVTVVAGTLVLLLLVYLARVSLIAAIGASAATVLVADVLYVAGSAAEAARDGCAIAWPGQIAPIHTFDYVWVVVLASAATVVFSIGRARALRRERRTP